MLIFEWDTEKARENEQKHGVGFSEASGVSMTTIRRQFRTPTIQSMRTDTSSLASKQGRYLVVSYTERGERIRLIPARQMTSRERRAYEDKDTLRKEYPESLIKSGVRAKYAKSYREGTNVVLIDPDLHKLFPDSEAVNRALRDYVAKKRTAT